MQRIYVADAFEPLPPPPPRPVEKPAPTQPEDFDFSKLVIVLPALLIGTGFLVWASTVAQRPPYNHFGVFLAAVGAIMLAAMKFSHQRKLTIWIGIIVYLIVARTWWKYDWWESSDTMKHEYDGGSTRYFDTYSRATGAITHRTMTVNDEDGGSLYNFSGPMSPSNKPHGHWEHLNWDTLKLTDRWYWYGEEITEGEWHLRNK
ncbi:MAG: hypothetical protein WDZ59_10145 [Pirellulales bacterium]